MEKDENIKRHRNVAHLWADKQVIRFFRKSGAFSKKDFKNLRSIYLALCEIDSDFGESKQINNFTKSVARYAGLNTKTVRPYLRALCKLNLIDYSQQIEEGKKFSHTKLEMFKWEPPTEKQIASANSTISRTPKNDPPGKPGLPKVGIPKMDPFKNRSKDLRNNFKNDNKLSSKEKNNIRDRIKPLVVDEEEKPKDKMFNARELARQFCDVYLKAELNLPKTSGSRFWTTVSYMNSLLKEDGLSPERISMTINWLAKNHNKLYTPRVADANQFRLKFVAIEQAMNRKDNGNGHHPSNPTSNRYRSPEPIQYPTGERMEDLYPNFRKD